MTTKITYGELYNDMVKCFSINQDNNEYKLGDYMRMKSDKKKTEKASGIKSASGLPVMVSGRNDSTAITAFFAYVNDKLTVKEAPLRDKTIRRFPLRTTITAFCSAIVVCALAICYGVVGLQSKNNENIMQNEQYEQVELIETELDKYDFI